MNDKASIRRSNDCWIRAAIAGLLAALAAPVDIQGQGAPTTGQVEIRVYHVTKTQPIGADRPETWVTDTAQMQFIEGKTAGPPAYLAATTGWLPLGPEMSRVMDSPKLGRLDARVRRAMEPGQYEVLARIQTGKARSALYVRVKAEPGARKASRLVSGFDRSDVYVAVRVKR